MPIICTNGNRGLLSEVVVSIPKQEGVPVPNCEENIEWWIQKAEDNADWVLNQLSLLEGKVAWTGWLLKRIIKEVYGE